MTTTPKRSGLWAVILAAGTLSVLTFTPIVIPPGQCEPTFVGLPRTLWCGVLVASGLVGLTALAAKLTGTDDSGNAP